MSDTPLDPNADPNATPSDSVQVLIQWNPQVTPPPPPPPPPPVPDPPDDPEDLLFKQGDMQYYDEEFQVWVILRAPAPAGLYVLTHNGTVPAWVETSECP